MRNPIEDESPVMREFYAKRDTFWRKVGVNETGIVSLFEKTMEEIVVAVQKSVSLDDCQYLHGRLAQYMNTLGEIAAKAEVEHLHVKDYLEDMFADEFVPTKERLEKSQTKVLKSEIETAIQRKYRQERDLMRFLYERWKIYKAKLSTGESMLEAIQNKVIQLRRQWEREYMSEALDHGVKVKTYGSNPTNRA